MNSVRRFFTQGLSWRPQCCTWPTSLVPNCCQALHAPSKHSSHKDQPVPPRRVSWRRVASRPRGGTCTISISIWNRPKRCDRWLQVRQFSEQRWPKVLYERQGRMLIRRKLIASQASCKPIARYQWRLHRIGSHLPKILWNPNQAHVLSSETAHRRHDF